MKSKNNGLKSILLAATLLCISITAMSQTVTIIGTQPVDIGCENKYTATVSNIPTDWTVVGYKWQATFVGSNGGYIRYIGKDNSGNQIPVTVTTANGIAVNAETKEFWVNWDNTFAPSCSMQVIFKIRYTLSGSQSINESGEYFLKDGNGQTSICLKGIPANPTFTGPTAVQKCCVSNVTYTATNYGDANTFDQWTYPAGWTQVSQIGNSITLTPNAATAGNVTCRVGISTACPAIYKTATIAVTRTDPAVTPITANFPTILLCPNNTYTYSVNAICGTTNYNWVFPSGWVINSGQGTPNVSVSTNAAPSSGNVTVTASFAGCSSVSYAALLNVLTTAPGPISTIFNYNYHCDGWYMCYNGGAGITTSIHVASTGAQTYTYRVVSPFYFKTNGGTGSNIQSITLASSYSPPLFSSQANKLTGTLYVKPNNCIGLGTEYNIPFTKEAGCWCDGSQPYPYAGNSNPSLCLTPPAGCGNTPLRPALNASEFVVTQNRIYPNPASSTIIMETIEKGTKSIRVISMSGKEVLKIFTQQQSLKVDISGLVQGIYLLEVSNETKKIMKEKILVNKQ